MELYRASRCVVISSLRRRSVPKCTPGASTHHRRLLGGKLPSSAIHLSHRIQVSAHPSFLPHFLYAAHFSFYSSAGIFPLFSAEEATAQDVRLPKAAIENTILVLFLA